ncbi:MAG: NAD-dependent epimerase/dehydratase family protein [Gammaproteobacteria bacterium]
MEQTRSLCIVTGANGFVGAHAVRRLRAHADVLAVDQFWGAEPRAEEPRVSIDLTRPLPDAPELRAATVVHAAGLVDAPDPRALWDANVAAVFNVLDWAVRHEARQVVLISCADVYPLREGARQREHDPTAPRDFAGHSRALAEQLAERMHRLHALPLTILRLFHPYGPGQTAGLAAGLAHASASGTPFCSALRAGARIGVVHVEDAAEAIDAAVRSAAGLRTLNVCADTPLTVADFAALVAMPGQAPARIDDAAAAAGDLAGENEAIRSALGWHARQPPMGTGESG